MRERDRTEEKTKRQIRTAESHSWESQESNVGAPHDPVPGVEGLRASIPDLRSTSYIWLATSSFALRLASVSALS